MLPIPFITIGLIALVALVLLMGLSAGNPAVVLMLAVFPVVVYFVSHPAMWLAALVAISWSRLTFPGAPANLNLFHILSLAFVLYLVFYRMLHRTEHRSSPVRKYVGAFVLVLIAVGAYSGFGLRVLGSELWGGSPYAILVIAGVLLLSADVVRLTPRQWQYALVAMCLMTFIPAVAQSIYVFSGGRIFLQYMFVQPKGFIMESLAAVSADTGVARFITDFGVTLLYIPLLLFADPMRGYRGGITLLAFVASLIVAGMSGSRYALIMVITFIFCWSLLEGRRVRWGRALVVMLGAAVLVAVAAPFARHFPLPIQRAISFVPWADISHMASHDAKGTAIWRMDVWERAIREDVPRYWLAGRGFAFNPREYAGIQMQGLGIRDWAFVTGSYHNGPLSLLINLGITGLLVGLGFFISVGREHLRLLRQGFADDQVARMHRLMLAMFINQSVLFLTLGGDVQNFFPVFLFQAMVLEGLAKTGESAAPEPASTPSPAAVAAPRLTGGAVAGPGLRGAAVP